MIGDWVHLVTGQWLVYREPSASASLDLTTQARVSLLLSTYEPTIWPKRAGH